MAKSETPKTFLGQDIPDGFIEAWGPPPDATKYRGDVRARQEAQDTYMQHMAEFIGLLPTTPELDNALAIILSVIPAESVTPFVFQHDPAKLAKFQGVSHRPTDGGLGPKTLALSFTLNRPIPGHPEESRIFVYDFGSQALANLGPGIAAIQKDLIQLRVPVPNPSSLLPPAIKTLNDALIDEAGAAALASLDLS